MIVRVVLLLLGLVSGVALAAAAYYGVFGNSAPKPQATAAPPPPPPAPKTMVVVASKPLPTGTLIAFQDLRFAPAPKGRTSGGEFIRPAAPNANKQAMADHKMLAEIVGAVARARFDQGDPLLRGEIVKPGDAGFLAAVLRPGMRAITIGVNLVTGGAGLIYPGDHVDVVLTQTFPGHETDPGNRSVSETIARDLRVIAVDQRLQAGGTTEKSHKPAQTITLEVTALQAEQIDVATKMGEVALAIRSIHSTAPGASGGETATRLPAVWAKDLSPAAAEVKPPNHPPTPTGAPESKQNAGQKKPQLRIIRGEKVENVVLP